MNKLLLGACELQKLRPKQGTVKLRVLTDAPEKFPDSECRRMFAPWSHWLQVVSDEPYELNRLRAIRKLKPQPGEITLAVFDDVALQQACQAHLSKLGARCITAEFPAFGTLDNDLVREVAHFDFEFGGKNEWNAAPTRHAVNCLRQLSSTHCKDVYPSWAIDGLLRRPGAQRPLKVMDIGCGPVSVLRWGAIQGDISITGVDPNLDMYAIVLARHGLDALPKIRCDREINGFAEDLEALLPDDEFDVIYTKNALDHTQQPARVIENIARKLAPHGLAVIQGATREGTRQKWDQLHKTDIYLKNGALMHAHQHGPEQPLLSPESRLRLKHVQRDTSERLACILEKQSAGHVLGRQKRWRLPAFGLKPRKAG